MYIETKHLHRYQTNAEFEAVYEPGKIEAISYKGGQEVSRDLLCTAGQPAQLKLSCSKNALK